MPQTTQKPNKKKDNTETCDKFSLFLIFFFKLEFVFHPISKSVTMLGCCVIGRNERSKSSSKRKQEAEVDSDSVQDE